MRSPRAEAYQSSDVVFLQDATGSQQPYINAARDCIVQICADLKQSGRFRNDSDLRFRVVAFRDHPPQEKSFLVQPVGGKFTSNIGAVQQELAALVADGGGDGPEAVADALDEALNSNWRDSAAKVVVLITDAPPHGIEDTKDGFPDGCPLRKYFFRVVFVC
jgi:Mg-chelatase subunit ChlD